MNPETGRFVSKDTFEGVDADPATLHKYLYASANPVMFVDPSGKFLAATMGSLGLRNKLTVKDVTLGLKILGTAITSVLVYKGLQTYAEVLRASKGNVQHLANERAAAKTKVERKKKKKGRLLFHYTYSEKIANDIMASGIIKAGMASGPYPPGAWATSIAFWLPESQMTRSQLNGIIAGGHSYAKTTYCVPFQEHHKFIFQSKGGFAYYYPGSAVIIPLRVYPNLLGEQ